MPKITASLCDTGSSFCDASGRTYHPPTAADLRAHADEMDKRERKAKADAKAYKARVKQQADDRETVRKNLLRVVEDPSKGYASVQAAEALSELGFI